MDNVIQAFLHVSYSMYRESKILKILSKNVICQVFITLSFVTVGISQADYKISGKNLRSTLIMDNEFLSDLNSHGPLN